MTTLGQTGIDLVVTSPGGNTTALIFGWSGRLDANRLNRQIMDFWKKTRPSMPEIEQCCLISPAVDPRNIGRVQMLGGEFCGNATRSAIYLLAGPRNQTGTIETSGSNEYLKFQITGGAVELTMPSLKAPILKVPQGYLINFEGIIQLVTFDNPKISAATMLKKLLKNDEFNINNLPATGVSYYNSATKSASFAVYVKAVETIFEETACGSGSAAIAIANAIETKQNQRLEINQPSREIIVASAEIDETGKILKSTISGEIKVLYRGSGYSLKTN